MSSKYQVDVANLKYANVTILMFADVFSLNKLNVNGASSLRVIDVAN